MIAVLPSFADHNANHTAVQSEPNLLAFVIGVIILIIIAILLVRYSRDSNSTPSSNSYNYVESGKRRGWTPKEQEAVRIRQNGLCNKCHIPPPRWEYHHRNGNRSDNRLSNCEGLCPNCHSVKTHG